MNTNSRILLRVFASRKSTTRASSFLIASLDSSRCCRLAAPSLGSAARWKTLDTKNVELVYENPYAFLVTRLKSVSLITCGLGLFGMPALISVYSGDLPLVKQYALAFAAVMSGGTTTVALAFVFDPYVHTIEKIPIRQCHAKIDLSSGITSTAENGTSATDTKIPPVSNESPDAFQSEEASPSSAPMLDPERITGELKSISSDESFLTEPEKPYLLRAITKNILLMTVETVFDPNKDIQPYDGYRPIANFAAKNKALYVHPELLFDETLRKQMHFLLQTKERPKEEEDDD